MKDACKFRSHSKRQKLTTEDVEYALSNKLAQPQYTFALNSPWASVTEHAAALLKDSESFYPRDRVVKLSDLLRSDISTCAVAPALTQYWMAIEGVEPRIRQNPSIESQIKEGTYTRRRKMNELMTVVVVHLHTHTRRSFITQTKEGRISRRN
jgi:transcription initiation factor TFIID subunit 6